MANATKRWLFIALVVLQTVIFGFGNVLTKIAYSDITPLWCLVLRFSLALVVFGALFGRRIVRQLRQVSVRSWLPAAVCMALSYIACNVALDLTTATNVGFLVALPVVFAPLLSSLVNRKRYPVAFLPFQGAVVVGLFLLCGNGGTLTFGLGEALALLSSVALAGRAGVRRARPGKPGRLHRCGHPDCGNAGHFVGVCPGGGAGGQHCRRHAACVGHHRVSGACLNVPDILPAKQGADGVEIVHGFAAAYRRAGVHGRVLASHARRDARRARACRSRHHRGGSGVRNHARRPQGQAARGGAAFDIAEFPHAVIEPTWRDRRAA